MISAPESVAVVANDAGAGNHILAWLTSGSLRMENARLCFGGPTLAAAKARFGDLKNLTLGEALEGASLLVSGTGWSSSLEHDARLMAHRMGVKSVAVIDHWTNYRERFVRDGVERAPDEIWVVDAHARALAEELLSGIPVRIQPNDYLEEQIRATRQFTFGASATRRVLFLMEPFRRSWGGSPELAEFQAFRYFMDHRAQLGLDGPTECIVKPHPSDPAGKYAACESQTPSMTVRVDAVASLAELLAWADIVVGCQSYAMVVAAAMGKRVVSCLPPSAPPCVLPQKEIARLVDLVGVP